jgi:hypothetical protein
LYKLNEADLAGDDSDMGSVVSTGGGMEELQRLPQPVLRLSFRSFGKANFNALGSKIVVTTGSLCTGRENSKCLTLVYDTKTGKQDIQPFVPDGLTGIYNTMAVGHKLYAFDTFRLPLYYLHDARAHPESADDGKDKSESESDSTDGDLLDPDDSDEEHDMNLLREASEERWTWKKSPMSIPCSPDNEFRTFYTAGHAVHPDGRTIFLSTVDNYPRKNLHGTFSLDLDTDQPGGGEWTHLGEWKLPFHSQANYDRELDAWVSFTYSEDTDGQHLYSCDLPATGGNPTPRPAWRLCKEQLTFMQAPLNAMCRTVVHTGPGRFCLVEVAPYIRFNHRRCLDVDQDLLQVTMFRATYGKNGELLATPLRPGRLYLIPAYDPQPPAFWM